MSKFSRESCHLFLQLAFIKLKTFVFTLKARHLFLKHGNLLFGKRILIVKKRNAFL